MISAYGFFIDLSFVISFATVSVILLYRKVPKMHVFFSVFLNFCITLYCAKLYTVMSHGFSISIVRAGFSSLGGAIGLLLGIIIYGFIYPPIRKDISNTYCMVLPLLYSISKLGCHFAGCCHGISYDGPFAISYDNEVFHTGKLFPVQASESVVFMLIFIICLVAFFKLKNQSVIPLVLILCGIGKFSLAFLREEQIGVTLSVNQIVCLFFIIVGIALLVKSKLSSNGKLNKSAS